MQWRMNRLAAAGLRARYLVFLPVSFVGLNIRCCRKRAELLLARRKRLVSIVV